MDNLWALDHAAFRSINLGWHSTFGDGFFWLISTTGLAEVQIVFLFLLFPWRAWLKAKGERLAFIARSLNFAILMSLAITGGITDTLKQLIPRDRPSNMASAIVAPDERIFYHSFPSGHTSSAFAVAFTVLLLARGRYRWLWAELAMLWACLVGISRIYRGVHWPSDVLAGACLGIAVSCLLRGLCLPPRNQA